MAKTLGAILKEISNEVSENVVMEFMVYFENELEKDMLHNALLGVSSFGFTIGHYFDSWATNDRIQYKNFRDTIKNQVSEWLSKEGLEFKSDPYVDNQVSWERPECEKMNVDGLLYRILTTTHNAQKFLTTDFYEFAMDAIKNTLMFGAQEGCREMSINLIDIFKKHVSKSSEYDDIWEEAWRTNEKEYIKVIENWALSNEIRVSHSSNYEPAEDACYITFRW